jgi:PPM family protein phosphatase
MIPAESPHLLVTATTHPGMSGKNNEDRYTVSAFRLSEAPNSPVLLAIVADGIGGHRAGEVASDIAVDKINHSIAEADMSQPVQALRQAIIQASQEILAQAEADPTRGGMGSTCVCALIIEDRLYTATVGDSRLYLIRDGEIRQLSTDHTWVQEAIDAGLLEPDQARTHPNAHVIRRHLGSQITVEPDTRLRLQPGETSEQAEANQGMKLLPGDQLLLCSDGLTDLVLDDEIRAAVRNKDQEKVNIALTDLANHRGGHDNITIVLLRIPEEAGRTGPAQSLAPTVRVARARRSWFALGAGAALVGLLVIAAIFGSFYAWTWVNSSGSSQTPLPVIETLSGPAATTRAAPQPPRLAATSTKARSTPFGLSTETTPGWMPTPSPSLTSPPVTVWPTGTGAP